MSEPYSSQMKADITQITETDKSPDNKEGNACCTGVRAAFIWRRNTYLHQTTAGRALIRQEERTHHMSSRARHKASGNRESNICSMPERAA